MQYLHIHINPLRQKIGAAAHMLRTEPAVGYRLIEETTQAGESPSPKRGNGRRFPRRFLA